MWPQQIWVFWKLLLCLKNTTTIRRFRACLFLLSFCGRWKGHFSGNRSKASRYSWVVLQTKALVSEPTFEFLFSLYLDWCLIVLLRTIFRGKFFPWKSNWAVFRLRIPVQGEKFRILRERLKGEEGLCCALDEDPVRCVWEYEGHGHLLCRRSCVVHRLWHQSACRQQACQQAPAGSTHGAYWCSPLWYLPGLLPTRFSAKSSACFMLSCGRIEDEEPRSFFFWSVFSNSEHSMRGERGSMNSQSRPCSLLLRTLNQITFESVHSESFMCFFLFSSGDRPWLRGCSFFVCRRSLASFSVWRIEHSFAVTAICRSTRPTLSLPAISGFWYQE